MDMVICDHSDKCEIKEACPHSEPHKRHKLDNFYDPCGRRLCNINLCDKRFCNIGPKMVITKCILAKKDYESIWG